MLATDRPGRHHRMRPGAADLIIFAHGLASFCYGLVFPYTAIYLAAKPAVGTGGSSSTTPSQVPRISPRRCLSRPAGSGCRA